MTFSKLSTLANSLCSLFSTYPQPSTPLIMTSSSNAWLTPLVLLTLLSPVFLPISPIEHRQSLQTRIPHNHLPSNSAFLKALYSVLSSFCFTQNLSLQSLTIIQYPVNPLQMTHSFTTLANQTHCNKPYTACKLASQTSRHG